MTQMVPFLVQEHYRIRDDTTAANPGTPNWITTEDQSADESIDIDKTFRIRMVLANTGSGTANSSFQLFVSKNGGSYTQITPSSTDGVQNADAGSSSDNTQLTSANFQLTAGTGNSGDGQYDEDGAVTTNAFNGGFFEHEWGLVIPAADVVNDDTLDFRMYYNGAEMDQYDITPRVIVVKAPGTVFEGEGTCTLVANAVADATRSVGAATGTAALTLAVDADATRTVPASGTSSFVVDMVADPIITVSGSGTVVFEVDASADATRFVLGAGTAALDVDIDADGTRTVGEATGTAALTVAMAADATITTEVIWTLVGELAFDVAAGSGDETKTLPGSVAEGDIVIIALACDTGIFVSSNEGTTTSGYEHLISTISADPGRLLSWKIMGATPDTDVDMGQRSGAKMAGVLQIWRPPAASPIDDTLVESNATTGYPNPASFTTLTANALRIIIGFLDDDDDASNVAAPSGYTDLLASDTGQSSSSFGCTVMIASKIEESAGADNPAAFTGSGNDNWRAAHFALTLLIPPAAGTGTAAFTVGVVADATRSVGAAAGTAAFTVAVGADAIRVVGAGAGTAAFEIDVAADAIRSISGTGTASLVVGVAADGDRVVGAATGTFAFVVDMSADASRAAIGEGTASFVLSMAADATRAVGEAIGEAAFAVDVDGAAVRSTVGAGTLALVVDIAADGIRFVVGSGTAAFDVDIGADGTTSGGTTFEGTGTPTLVALMSADAARIRAGFGTADTVYTLAGDSTRSTVGAGTAALTANLAADASRQVGAASGTMAFVLNTAADAFPFLIGEGSIQVDVGLDGAATRSVGAASGLASIAFLMAANATVPGAAEGTDYITRARRRDRR